jgi:hypothetical protein
MECCSSVESRVGAPERQVHPGGAACKHKRDMVLRVCRGSNTVYREPKRILELVSQLEVLSSTETLLDTRV